MPSPAKPTGIGRLCDLMVEALETGNASNMQPRKDEKTGGRKTLWQYEIRGHTTEEPSPRGPRPIGSGNFGVVANLCELVVSGGRDQRAAGWLRSFYERQGPGGDLGHMLFEPLSHVYGDVHIVSALLTIAAGKRYRLNGSRRTASQAGDQSALSETVEQAAGYANAMLARELALCLLHRAPGGRITHAGTRSKAPKAGERSVARETFVRLALTGRAGNQRPGRIEQAFKLAGWSAPIFDAAKSPASGIRGGAAVDPQALQPYLREIRFASGPLVVTHFENGHVSRFETGPVCYQSPMPACAVRYEPWEVWPFLRPGKGHQRGLRTSLDDGALLVSNEGEDGIRVYESIWVNHHNPPAAVDLGAVVAEHRIEGIPL